MQTEFDVEESLRWFRGAQPYPEGLSFRRADGGKHPMPDFVKSSIASPIISEAVVEVLSREHATGWDAFPLMVTRDGVSSVRYGLAVLGKCGPPDDSKASMRPITLPGNVTLTLPAGLHFDPDSWDGTDVFSPAGTAFVLVTDRIRTAFARAELSGLRLIHLDDVVNFGASLA